MKKLLLILFTLLFLFGCNSKKYYTLGSTLNIESTTEYTQEIDVVKVNVPKYLRDHTLVRQITPYQVEIIDKAQWLTPMQKRLTNILIDYLQKSMNNPNVHLYPWNANKHPKKRVAVTINRFIAYKKEVILQANYKITHMDNKKIETKLFNITIDTKDETLESMMEAMESAYFELSKTIKNEIIK